MHYCFPLFDHLCTLHLCKSLPVVINGIPLKLRFRYITVTSLWARWRIKSPVSRLFTQAFIQTQIKENIKAPRHWPLCGEFIGDRWIPPHKWPVPRKMFPFDDVIMRFRAQGTTRSPLCSIQSFKMFGWLRNTLWANETSWNLSLRRGYGGMSCILPGPCLNIKTVFLCMRIAIITIRRSYLYNGPYTDTTTYLYWDAPQPLYPWLSLIYYRPFIHIQFK